MKGKKIVLLHIGIGLALAALAAVFVFTRPARAAAAGAASGLDLAATSGLDLAATSGLDLAAALIGAALSIGLCCIGTGIAVGSAATAAIGAISENEGLMGKALIFVAMAEGIAIYGLLVAFMILGRV